MMEGRVEGMELQRKELEGKLAAVTSQLAAVTSLTGRTCKPSCCRSQSGGHSKRGGEKAKGETGGGKWEGEELAAAVRRAGCPGAAGSEGDGVPL